MTCTRMLVCGLVLLMARAAAAETLEEAMEKMAAAHQKLKSMTAGYKMTSEMDMGEGNLSKSEAKGTLEWMRKGDKKLFRSDMKTSSAQKYAGQESKFDQTSTTIGDGEYMYSITDTDGQKAAYKNKVDPAMDDSPAGVLNNLKEGFTLKLLPDDKVDGAECWVIDCTAKETQGSSVLKQLAYFRKDSGVQVKMDGRDKDGKTVSQYVLTDLKLNTEIAADRFVFKAPEGVEVMDMTQSMDPGKQP